MNYEELPGLMTTMTGEYGTVTEHDRANGLDTAGLSRAMDLFFGQ